MASKYVSSKVRAAGLLSLYGEEGSVNVQGEVVKKVDVLANEAFITSLKRSQKVHVMVSEENPDPIVVEDSKGCPRFYFTSLFEVFCDGSPSTSANISIGTIFGIYKKTQPDGPILQHILRPGRELFTQVAAGYAMYGSTILVLSFGDGVNGFTLDPSAGEFVLTHPNIKIKPKIYSINEGNAMYWHDPVKKYVESVKFPKTSGAKPYSLRYVGSYGGVFMYPGDKNAKDGKLRLLYEANPMAYIIEQAGGKASTGTQRILDVQPTSIHQRVPVFLGSPCEIDAIEALHKESRL